MYLVEIFKQCLLIGDFESFTMQTMREFSIVFSYFRFKKRLLMNETWIKVYYIIRDSLHVLMNWLYRMKYTSTIPYLISLLFNVK